MALEGLGPHGLRQVLEVDLVADAGARGHDREVVEGRLAPLEEGVALAVALVLERDVVGQRLRGAELVDDDRVVDDEVDGDERVDLLRVAAERHHGVAHRREIDHRRHAGEVLHQHARGAERDLDLGLAAVLEPADHGLDVGLLDRAVVLVAEQVLEQHLHREGQAARIRQAVLLGLGDRVDGVGLGAGLDGLAGLEAVDRCHGVVLARGCRTRRRHDLRHNEVFGRMRCGFASRDAKEHPCAARPRRKAGIGRSARRPGGARTGMREGRFGRL